MELKKITALGDSLTRGVVLNEKNRYSILDNSFIDIISETLGLEITNYGKFGCTRCKVTKVSAIPRLKISSFFE